MVEKALEGMGNEGIKAAAADGIIEPDQVAAAVIEGLKKESFDTSPPGSGGLYSAQDGL